ARFQVDAEQAEVKRGEAVPPLETYWVTPRRGARAVLVRARDGALAGEGRYEIGPPAARVQLSLLAATPVKNRDTSAELAVRLLKPDGSVDVDSSEPVIRANVGRVEGLTRTAPGVYRARYVLPETRYPEVVVIVAFAPWPHPQSVYGAFGSLLVPLASAIDLPGKTERNAQTWVEIAGITYGPVQAGADGKFKLPVVVPPGHRFGRGTAVDRAGNKRTMEVDLLLPPTDQLSCVHNPTRLPANGVAKARILCATSDPYGKPFAGADVRMVARRGGLEGPRRLEGGMLEWIYTAPAKLGDADVVTATWKQAGSNSKDELAVELVQGPAAILSLSSAEPVAHFGGSLAVIAKVKDALDRPRAGAHLALSSPAGGGFSSPSESTPGQLSATWEPPPDGTPGPARLEAEAFGPPGKEPAQLAAWIRGGTLFAGVADLAGLPVAGQRLLADGRPAETGDDGSVALGPASPGKVQLKLEAWPALQRTLYLLDAQTLWPPSTPLATPRQTLELRLEPAIPVNIRLKISGHSATYWVEDPKGKVIPHREVSVSVSGGTAGRGVERDGRTTLTVETRG
ncbi:MAG TPA: hypothetical protein VH208_10160, partial [Myxococcaceae bacterium]|nr:hypothetical protein [Myxococcaceae bacterium]